MAFRVYINLLVDLLVKLSRSHLSCERGVDVLTPAAFIEISQAGGRGNVKPILRSLHRQIQNKSEPLRLKPAECRILLSIRVLVLWKFRVDSDGEAVLVIHKEPSGSNYLYWDDHENREKELLCLAGKELSPDFVDRCFAFIENSFKPRRRIVYDAAYDEFMEEVRRHTCQRPRESSATLQFEQKN